MNGLPSYDYSSAPKGIIDNTQKIFIGIPVLLAMEGSTARYNKDWLITAGHNKFIESLNSKNFIRHPTCDIALIHNSVDSKHDNSVGLGKIYSNEPVWLVGYPGFSPIAVNKATYNSDFKGGLTGSKSESNCQYSAFNGVAISGMSGGGVYNKDGKLSGIITGIATLVNSSGVKSKHMYAAAAMISTYQNWITNTINSYNNSHQKL